MSIPDANPQERTTLFGKPIEYKHDPFTNMMPDGGMAGAGANLLPPGFTDNSQVSIPIKMSDLEDEPVKPPPEVKKSGLFGKLSKGFGRGGRSSQEIKVVQMSRGDYLKYWAKGEDGQYLPNVVEPPMGRKEWVSKQMRMIEARKEYDASL